MSSKISYYSKGNTVDGTNVCSGVETLAENLMEDNEEDAVITFPAKGGWASLRSTSFRITDENAMAVLPLPIYKINKFLIRPVGLCIRQDQKVTTPGGEFVESVYLPYNSYNVPDELDITDCVKTVNEWKALPRAETTEDYLTKACVDNTFYWQSGDTFIHFLNTQYVIPGDLFENALNATDKNPVYLKLLSRVLYRYLGTNNANFPLLGSLGADVLRGNDGKEYEIRDCLFQIEYVPITSSTKMRARKSAKTKIDFFQPFNQRAELNAVGAFGKNMWLTAQKTGVREITVVKNYTRLADIPPLGALVLHKGKKYRLIANKRIITNTQYMQVIHTLSENWSAKSKYISVDQKYRNWSIPQDVLWRNLYWEDFFIISKNAPTTGTKGSIAIKHLEQVFKSDIANDRTVDSFFISNVPKNGYDYTAGSDGKWKTVKRAVHASCSAYPLGNSLVFSASMKDNLSAGLKRYTRKIDNDDSETVCEECFYCNSDGTADNMTVILSDGIDSGFYPIGQEWIGDLIPYDEASVTLNQDGYPESILEVYDEVLDGTNYKARGDNLPRRPVFNETFWIDKDPGEALKFTYQIHFMEDDPDIVLGEVLTAKHPLISKATKNRSFFVFVSSSYLREGEQMIPDGEFFYHNGEYFNTYLETNGDFGYFSLVLTMNFVQKIINKGDSCKSWGIADADKRLIVGCNDTNARTLFFSLTHKR